MGYKGALPAWCKNTVPGPGAVELKVNEDLSVRFLPLSDDIDLDLYRAAFMQRIFVDVAPTAVIYLDPDIVIDEPWSFFEDWVTYGIAVCADKYWNVHTTHPLRHPWRQRYEQLGLSQRTRLNVFVNSGYVGVSSVSKQFLQQWIEMQSTAPPGLPDTSANFRPASVAQCALNAALETTELAASILGADAMGFASGHRLMYKTAPYILVENESSSKQFSSINAARAYLRYSDKPLKVSSGLQDLLRRADYASGFFTGRRKRRTRDNQ